MKTPVVSVILPIYNRADLLPCVVDSVLQQDFTDLELLVVDDGSSDSTPDVIREIQSRDKRVVDLRIPCNRGVGFAREAGLRRARGEYIAWIDSDDLWLAGKLQDQLTIMQAYPEIDILFADWWNIDHNHNTRESGFFQHKLLFETLELQPLEADLFRVSAGLPGALMLDSLIHFQTVLLRSSVLLRAGGIDFSLGSAEDFEFFFRAALLGATFAYQDHPVAERHKYESGITSNRVFSWRETLRALERSQRLAEKMGRRDLFGALRRAKQRAVQNLIWEYGWRGERAKVLQVAVASLQTGFSLRTLGFVCVAMFGKSVQGWLNQRRETRAGR